MLYVRNGLLLYYNFPCIHVPLIEDDVDMYNKAPYYDMVQFCKFYVIFARALQFYGVLVQQHRK